MENFNLKKYLNNNPLLSINEGAISLTPEENQEVNELVPFFIEGIKNKKIGVVLTNPIKYKMASGETAYFRPYIYDEDDQTAAHFRSENEQDLEDNLIGINYNYYGPAFDGTISKIWSYLTGDSPKENLISSIKHELIHAKDPATNQHKLKVEYDPSNPSNYYGSWTEFPAQTGEFLEALKTRTLEDIEEIKRYSTDDSKLLKAKELQSYFQDILDFYSGKDKTFNSETWEWISGGEKGDYAQQFVKNIINFGFDFLGFRISPGWEQLNQLGKFAAKIEAIKQYNPEGYKEFQKDLYKLIQELIDKINSVLPEGNKISAGGTGSFKDIDENKGNIDKLQELIQESLRDWFKKENWVRIDTAGNITGPCGTMKPGKATTRCLPKAKAQRLTKAQRAATARKKVAGSKKGKQFVSNTPKAKVRFRK